MRNVTLKLATAAMLCTFQSQASLIEGQLITTPMLSTPVEQTEFVSIFTGNVASNPPAGTLALLAHFNPAAIGPLAAHFTVTGFGGLSALVSWDLAGTNWQVDYVLLSDGAVPGTQADLRYYYLYGVSPNACRKFI